VAGVHVVDLAERPDLVSALWDLPQPWPEFMGHDPHGVELFPRLPEVFPEWQLVALDDAGMAVGKVHAVPFAWDLSDPDLPASGWDGVLARAFTGRWRGTRPTAVSLLEARLAPSHLGGGRSRLLLEAAAERAVARGLPHLVGPVRPTHKHLQPHLPMQDYVQQRRADGLPVDPWLRVHARMGGRVVGTCPASMVIAGSLAAWRSWTGLPFDESGATVVPFALNPVHVSVEQDHAVYVEPNVWVHHDLTGRTA
jgi:GNAT superfamily N-acetyltransferase